MDGDDYDDSEFETAKTKRCNGFKVSITQSFFVQMYSYVILIGRRTPQVLLREYLKGRIGSRACP
jgi:hypothetical protein